MPPNYNGAVMAQKVEWSSTSQSGGGWILDPCSEMIFQIV